jgi:hypothetical protein
MKTIRITLEKPGAKAILHHVFRTDNFPVESRWTGDKEAFTGPSGRVPHFTDVLDHLEATVAHQAALCGAQYEIEDLGGEVKFWMDIVETKPPEEAR